jgi:6-phosphogluconolactonase
MIEAEWWEYDDAGEMAEAVAGDIGFLIGQALDARGDALVAFPGGATPLPVFETLARQKIAWKKVTILPTDERLVPMTDALSNVRMLAAQFLPVGARVVPLAGAKVLEPDGAARVANAMLEDFPWPPDLIWLGVGADGHTASLFPGPDYQAALASAERVAGVRPDPLPADAPVARITLTRSAILSARALTITIRGAQKRAVLERALAEGAASALPIGRVLADCAQAVDIHWCP